MGTSDSLFFPIVANVRDEKEAARLLSKIVSDSIVALKVNRFGASLDSESGMLVAVFTRRLAQLGAFPMSVEPGSTHLLWGSLVDDARCPSLLLSTPDEALFETRVHVKAGLFWTQIFFPDEPGTYTVELLVNADGPQVAALFPVYAGVAPPETPVLKLYPGTDDLAEPASMEAQALTLINKERKKRNLAPCAIDKAMTRGARQYSAAMADAGRLTHALAPKPGNVRENISLSTSIATAHANLMACPSHRRNIIDDEAVRCGVGVAAVTRDGVRLIYMTQRFSSR
jgi:uncharacterized protein YkwD